MICIEIAVVCDAIRDGEQCGETAVCLGDTRTRAVEWLREQGWSCSGSDFRMRNRCPDCRAAGRKYKRRPKS